MNKRASKQSERNAAEPADAAAATAPSHPLRDWLVGTLDWDFDACCS